MGTQQSTDSVLDIIRKRGPFSGNPHNLDRAAFITEAIKQKCDRHEIHAYQLAVWFDRVGGQVFEDLTKQMTEAWSAWTEMHPEKLPRACSNPAENDE